MKFWRTKLLKFWMSEYPTCQMRHRKPTDWANQTPKTVTKTGNKHKPPQKTTTNCQQMTTNYQHWNTNYQQMTTMATLAYQTKNLFCFFFQHLVITRNTLILKNILSTVPNKWGVWIVGWGPTKVLSINEQEVLIKRGSYKNILIYIKTVFHVLNMKNVLQGHLLV